VAEVLALAPIVVAATLAFAVAATRLSAMARAEAALARVIAIDAAGMSIGQGLPERVRITRVTRTTVTITVPAPLRAIVITGERAR
jgi:hypothetical protein